VQGTNGPQLATTAFVVAQAFAGVLPAQPGNAGKALVTNGTSASWSTLAWASLSGIPTTLAGFGITDAASATAPSISNITLTGTTAAPTQAVDNSSTSIVTTAWYMGQGSALPPSMNGVQTVGAGTAWARSDHIHPVDSSRQPSLGFTPPRVPGNSSGSTNTVSFGWNGTASKLVCAVDLNQFGNQWPIDITGNCGGTAAGANLVNGQSFPYSNPNNSPTYVWSSNSPNNNFLAQTSQLAVRDAAGVNGITGWRYSNLNFNPAYLWATNGAATDQFLVTPSNLTVGTSSNTAAFQGQAIGYFINNAGSAVVNIRNDGSTGLRAGIGGFGDVVWSVFTSDERLKKDIAPTTQDSMAKIKQIEFIEFKYITMPNGFEIDDTHTLHKVGMSAQKLQAIEPEWVNDKGEWLSPNTDKLVWSLLHAVQQLEARVAQLEARA
jgi:hypothetical protein